MIAAQSGREPEFIATMSGVAMPVKTVYISDLSSLQLWEADLHIDEKVKTS